MNHFPQTEIRAGPKYTAACPQCGWRKIASSHAHSWELGQDHIAETRLAGRDQEGTTP